MAPSARKSKQPPSASKNPNKKQNGPHPHEQEEVDVPVFEEENPFSEISHHASDSAIAATAQDEFGSQEQDVVDAVGIADADLQEEEGDETGNEEEEGPVRDEDDEEHATGYVENLEENLVDGGTAMQNGYMDSDDGDTKHASVSAKESSEGTAGSGGKIFIGGLTRDTTTEMLTNHFKRYGEIIDSVIMRHRITGHPRGFGFVTFADPSVVDVILKETHILDGKMVEAKRTVPRDIAAVPSKGPKTKKIFVGGLKTSTTEDEFKRFFERFGRITECQIMQDHNTGRSRGFGFVTFDSEHSVEDVLAQGNMHELDGKQVEIKKAEPKRADEAPLSYDRSAHHRGRGSTSYDTNVGYYGALNAPAPYYGGAAGGPGLYRGSGRAGGYAYGTTYGYGANYGGYYGFGDVDDAYGGMAYNYTGYGSGSGYGNVYGGGSYGGSSRGYSSGRYHPYGR